MASVARHRFGSFYRHPKCRRRFALPAHSKWRNYERRNEVRTGSGSDLVELRRHTMNAAAQIEKDKTETQLPNSRRIYIEGTEPGVRVPFREIDQIPTRNFKNELEENPPVRVYDTSGPHGDPSMRADVREGLKPLRRDWIANRGDVEEYEGRTIQPIDDGYLTFDAANQARQKEKAKDLNRLEDFSALVRTPLRAKKGACVTQMHYAKQGIITPEMEFIAIRENLGRNLECGDLSPL